MLKLSRRSLLQALATLGLWPLGSGTVQAAPGLTIRYGWDPDIEAPVSASIYVAPAGDDAADGSIERPLRTIQRGVEILSAFPGGSLSIRQGTYREMVSLDALQGQPGAGYRIHRYGREQVRITAADVLTGWRPCKAAEAAEVGCAPEGVYVARFSSSILQHNSIYSLNLHEKNTWCPIATDRADMSNPVLTGDYETYHPAQFLLDGDDIITAIRDPRLAGLPEAHMRQVRVLIYHIPNMISGSEIAGFDPVTGTITLSTPSKRVQITDGKAMMLYALQNTAAALQDRSWIARDARDGEIAVYFRPADPANLDSDIEISVRPVCIDFGKARNVELLGLEVIRAAGQELLDGICIRRTIESDGAEQSLKILHCRTGENFSAADRGYAALYLRGATGVTIHNTSIGPTHNSFGLFLSACRQVDLRFLHIAGASNSPARFFDLHQSVLAFSLFEDSGYDAHSNKFNFYLGSDSILVYGVRTRRTGGYATYQEASRIHFAFCEFDCSVGVQNRALVSQNYASGSGHGGSDGSGDPVAGSTFYYWNNSLLANLKTPKPANSLVLGPAGTSQHHSFYNNILHGGGFAAIYREGVDPNHQQRSHNRYTGLSFWQSARYGWRLGPAEEGMRVGSRPTAHGKDMRPLIEAELSQAFPGFSDWNVDIDGNTVDWTAPPIGCKV